MGDIADMMLEGDLCATCGVYLDGDGDGIPRYCSDECDPHYEEQPQRKPESDKPFFVVKHAGSVKALPRFLQGVSFAYLEEATDKKGNPMIRLRSGMNTQGIVVIVSPYLLDQTRQAIDNHLAVGTKP